MQTEGEAVLAASARLGDSLLNAVELILGRRDVWQGSGQGHGEVRFHVSLEGCRHAPEGAGLLLNATHRKANVTWAVPGGMNVVMIW